MKKIYLYIIIFLLHIVTFSQTTRFSYDYDANGNRIQREMIILSGGSKSMIVDNDTTYNSDLSMIRKDDIIIYPNPTRGHLKIEIASQIAIRDIIVEVFNIRGQSVYKNRDKATAYDVDLSYVVNGSYILAIRLNEIKYEWRIIKE